MKFIKKRWYFIVIFFLIVGFIIYRQFVSQQTTKKQTNYTIKRQNLQETLSISGNVDALEHVILRFQTSGRLGWVGVKEGDYVKKYQTIASLDQRDLQKTLKKYLLAYENDRYSFEQSQDDNKTDVIALSSDLRSKAQRLLEESQNDLDSSVLDVELQSLSLEYANLYSPIEGLVTRVNTPYAGINITPAQAEFEIINPKTIYFSATADQSDVVNLKQGMDANIVLDAYPDKTIKGKVTEIAFTPKTDETGTTYEVKLNMNVDNAASAYRYGMTGDVDFVTRTRENVLAVPSTYIKTQNGKKYVMKLDNGKQIKTYVNAGDEIDDSTVITSGLSEKDIIVN